MGRKLTIYKCKKCGYTTKRKTNFITHTSRKKPCSPPNDDNKIIESLKVIKESLKVSEKSVCEYCNKSFTNKKSIYGHLKICKIKQQNDYEIKLKELEKQLKQSKMEKAKLQIEKDKLNIKLEEERKYAKDTISDLAKSNKILSKHTENLEESIKINMTMHNYFIVNEFGKENLDYIDMSKILKDYNSLTQMVAKHLQLKHFSKCRENHNLILDRNNAKIYKKNGVWETKEDVNLFLVKNIIDGTKDIDGYKKDKNIIFELKKEKNYKKDKKYLLNENIDSGCFFNPSEAEKRLDKIEELKSSLEEDDYKKIERKHKKEVKTAKKQSEVKEALIKNLEKAIKEKHIKAGMVKFKNY